MPEVSGSQLLFIKRSPNFDIFFLFCTVYICFSCARLNYPPNTIRIFPCDCIPNIHAFFLCWMFKSIFQSINLYVWIKAVQPSFMMPSIVYNSNMSSIIFRSLFTNTFLFTSNSLNISRVFSSYRGSTNQKSSFPSKYIESLSFLI